MYNNCLTYNGLNNSYTNTAQKLLAACQQACQVDFDNQMSHLEEEINNKIMISIDDDHSQSGIFSNTGKSSSAADYLADSDSNFISSSHNDNENIDDVQMNHFSSNQQPNNSIRYSSTTLLPQKKVKSSNKNISSNNSTDKSLKSNFHLKEGDYVDVLGSNLNKKKKQNPIFSSVIKFNKNSPKSSSDAETYVDVESIDERAGFHSLIRQNSARYTTNKKTIEEENVYIDNQEEIYEYNENQFEENS